MITYYNFATSALTIEGAPWGTISNSPATLNVLAGLVVPVGSLVTGMPEI